MLNEGLSKMTLLFALSSGFAGVRKAALVSVVAISWMILAAAPSSATASAATAGFVKTDTTAEGSWIGELSRSLG